MKRKVVFGFKNETQNNNRKKNDFYFSSHQFTGLPADGDSEEEILNYLSENIADYDKPLNIIVDYSTMTRIWYSAIIKFFYFDTTLRHSVNLFFGYSISKYSPSPSEISYNLHIGPIRGFSNLTIPQKPTALIIGLGYEKSRALGLNEYFDGETFAFYTDDSKENKFAEEIKRNNSHLLSQLKSENICTYSIRDLNSLYNTLFSLCKDLSETYRVILTSCGPKPFTFISLIIALEQRNVDVWRISAGKNAIPIDKLAEGDITIFQLAFQPHFSLQEGPSFSAHEGVSPP